MKTYHCPLCGLAYIDVRDCGHYLWRCAECDYELGESVNLDDAIKAVETFLSKFPPIMRLNVGDKIEFYGYLGTIVDLRLNHHTIEVNFDSNRNYYLKLGDGVKYPWELEETIE